MTKQLLQLGAILGAFSVILGAFAAHSLKNHLSPDQIEIFQTGVRYQFYHTFAILAAGILSLRRKNKHFGYAGVLFFIGILLFSGSLYLLASRYALGIDHWSWLGPLTPIGGVFFIAGWVLFFIGTLKLKDLNK